MNRNLLRSYPTILIWLFFAALASLSPPAILAQSNTEQGSKPNDTTTGGGIDAVSLTNGSLLVTVPVATFQQRGDLSLSFAFRQTSKQWSVRSTQGANAHNYWFVNPAYQSVLSSMDYFVNSTDYGDAGTTSTSVISPDGGSHALYQAGIYPARSVDATGLVMTDASTVITHAGVRLRYTAPQTVWLGLQPTAAIDRNGNQITMSSSGWFDTLERRIPGSPFPDAANPNPIEPGVWTADWANCPSSTTTMARVWDVPDIGGGTRRFKFCYAATTLNPSFGFTNVQENPVSATLLTTIVMPNLTSWTFSYDNFGDIARIVYPTGGSIAYTYATRRGNTCTGEMTPGSRWVATRTVDANDGTGGHRWVYTYDSTAGTTTVSDPLGNDVVHTIAAPVAGACTLFDVRQKSYQGSASSGTLLRTVDQQYGGIPSPVQAVAVSAANVVPTQVTTTLPGGQVSKTTYQYDAGVVPAGGSVAIVLGSLLQTDVYDDSGSVRSSTLNHYKWQDDPNYLSGNLLDPLTSTIVQNGLKQQSAMTTFGYDDPPLVGCGFTSVNHVVAPGTRANQTTSSRWLDTDGTMISSHTKYYDTGVPATVSDPLGHTTSFQYSPVYLGTYLTLTTYPDTQMPDAGAPVVSHTTSAVYDSNTGLVTQTTDQNGNQTNSSYDNMHRLAGETYADQGQTTFLHPDATSVETRHVVDLVNRTVDIQRMRTDGLARTIHTEHVTSGGTVVQDIAYDAVGHASSIANPCYLGAPDATCGTTASTYDALGRTLTITQADGSVVANHYTDNCITSTDQAGNPRRSCSNVLGQLVELDEPRTGVSATTAAGSVTIASPAATLAIGQITINSFNANGSVQTVIGGSPSSPKVFKDTGSVTLTVNGKAYTCAYPTPAGTSAIVASNLAGQVQNDGTSPVSASVSGTVITLTARTAGKAGNSITLLATYNHTATTMFPNPSFTDSVTQAMSFGADAGQTADSGTISATIGSFAPPAISYGSATNGTPAQVASALAQAFGVAASPVFVSGVVNNTAGSTISFTAKTTGPGGNMTVTATPTSSLPKQYPNGTFGAQGALSGGSDPSIPDLNAPFVSLFTYDTLGRLRCVEQHGDATTGTGCGADPSLDATSPWRVRRFNYDSLSRMISASSPESGAICYGSIDATGKCNSSYDVDSRLLRQTDARGIVTTFTYDSQHRLLGKTYSDGTPKANYRYDTNTFLSGLALTNALGRRVAAWTDAGIGSITSYGAMGQVTTSYQCLPACQSFSTTYDGGGNALSLAYPNGFTMNYTYDTAGRIMSATDASGFVYAGTLRYFPSGALYILSRPHLYLENGLNNRLQPTYGYAGDNAGTSLFYKQYNYDTNGHNNGNLLSSVNVNDPTRNETFAYDGLNRLIQANEGVIWGDTYKFDPWGNLLSKVKAPGTTRSEDTSVSVDVRNRLATVQYDNSGNLASDGIHTYRHDAENRLIAFDSTTYTYDADGRRISKSGGPTYWYGPGGMLLGETDTSGAWTTFALLGGRRLARKDPDASIRFFVSDHLGSTSLLVDQNGTIVDDHDFYPWGGIVPGVGRTGSNNAFLFTGQERDPESNLDFFGTRYYSFVLGRFEEADPVRMGAKRLNDPQLLNRYTYARNNPMGLVDPDGRDPIPAALLSAAVNMGANARAYADKKVEENGGADMSLDEYNQQHEFYMRDYLTVNGPAIADQILAWVHDSSTSSLEIDQAMTKIAAAVNAEGSILLSHYLVDLFAIYDEVGGPKAKAMSRLIGLDAWMAAPEIGYQQDILRILDAHIGKTGGKVEPDNVPDVINPPTSINAPPPGYKGPTPSGEMKPDLPCGPGDCAPDDPHDDPGPSISACDKDGAQEQCFQMGYGLRERLTPWDAR